MAVIPQTLNQYIGTDKLGNSTTIVAADMTTACEVYYEQEAADPVTMQLTKQNIKCVLPDVFVSFVTEVYDTTGAAATSCSATPGAYTLPAGSKQIFTAIAGEGWVFSKWQIDGEDIEGEEGTKPVAMLTIPTKSSPITIRAVFTTKVTI